jgi:hypothetical protein
MEVPFPDSYWVEPGLLLAGEYPSELSPELTRLRLRRMLDLGIRQFIDLTQPELTQSRPYRDALAEVAQEMGVKDTIIFNYPIPDLEIPARDLMRSILDTLDKAVSGKFPIYVHCWAGIGRTGTVVGCYLVRRDRGRGDGTSVSDATSEPIEVEQQTAGPVIARRKSFTLVPMDEEEALEQMVLLGHELFFIFYNVNTNSVNVLYQRRDGTYGLIEPKIG